MTSAPVIPSADLLGRILLWIGIWVVVGGGFVVLVRKGRDYIRGWTWTVGYFSVGTLLAGMLFRGETAPLLRALGPVHLGLAVGWLALQGLAHRVAHRLGSPPRDRIAAAPHVYWLRMDLRYLASKSFEILFQQTMLWSLVRMLADAGLATREVVALAVPVFALVHLPIIRLVGRFFGLYYLVSSLFAAVLMPGLILARPDGFVYAYLLHSLYYLGSQLLFWRWRGKVPKGRETPYTPPETGARRR